ncbi:MAG: hypothetical protein WC558_02005 [Patulibacter sp.]
MSSLSTTQLASRPRRGRVASRDRSDGRAASSRRLLHFPFVIAALITMLVAAFVLFGAASRDQAAVAPTVDPWNDVPHATERVPATPSRGAMGGAPPVVARTVPATPSRGAMGVAPRAVSARTAP